MHPQERPSPEGSLAFAPNDIEMPDAPRRRTGLSDLTSEVLCMIMKEISDDLKHKGEPSDRRLYALGANVSQELYDAVVAYQGGCKKIKVTAVCSNAPDFDKVERELKRCVKSKLWSPIERSGAKTQPAVYFEINDTAEAPNEHNSKIWWFAFDRRIMCGLAAALTGIDLSYCVPLKKMVINAQAEQEVRDTLLPLLAFLRIREDHESTTGSVLKVTGLDDLRTALLFEATTSEAISREAITNWLKVVSDFIFLEYSISFGNGEAAHSAFDMVFHPQHHAFKQLGFHQLRFGRTTNEHIYIRSVIHTFALRTRNRFPQYELHWDEDLTAPSLESRYEALVLRAQNANLWVGSEGDERDERIFQVAKLQYNWVKIFKEFDPLWDPTGFLQKSGRGFKAVKHFPGAAKLLERVEKLLAELGARVPPVGAWSKMINDDREHEYYPKEHKDWWCTLVTYKRPSLCSWFVNYWDMPTFPKELDFDDLAKKWEEGKVDVQERLSK